MTLPRSAALCAAILCGVSTAWGAGDPSLAQRAASLAGERCVSCHRPRPADNPPLVPALQGQQKAYLAWQMRAYRMGFRDDPQAHDRMWEPTGKLDDALIDALAAYFAAQPPPAAVPADPALAAKGRTLYQDGIPSRNVTACRSCHGEHAEGHGVFPRLAGQRADYVVRQLSLIQRYLRNVGIMHSTVDVLSEDDFVALAAYLQSL
jgi:cytochrome c553